MTAAVKPGMFNSYQNQGPNFLELKDCGGEREHEPNRAFWNYLYATECDLSMTGYWFSQQEKYLTDTHAGFNITKTRKGGGG